jgi:hypothetical protein
MVVDTERREKMKEFFRENAYNPLPVIPEKYKRKDSSPLE